MGLIELLFKYMKWTPLKKRVYLYVEECMDKSLVGTKITGTIIELVSNYKTFKNNKTSQASSVYAVIQLKETLAINNQHYNYLIAVPRHLNYGLYRLPVTAIAVYVQPVMSLEELEELNFDKVIGIWGLSLR